MVESSLLLDLYVKNHFLIEAVRQERNQAPDLKVALDRITQECAGIEEWLEQNAISTPKPARANGLTRRQIDTFLFLPRKDDQEDSLLKIFNTFGILDISAAEAVSLAAWITEKELSVPVRLLRTVTWCAKSLTPFAEEVESRRLRARGE
jgi:hypothetical protein